MARVATVGPNVTLTYNEDGSVTSRAPETIVLFCRHLMQRFDLIVGGVDLETPEGQQVRDEAVKSMALVIATVAGDPQTDEQQ